MDFPVCAFPHSTKEGSHAGLLLQQLRSGLPELDLERQAAEHRLVQVLVLPGAEMPGMAVFHPDGH